MTERRLACITHGVRLVSHAVASSHIVSSLAPGPTAPAWWQLVRVAHDPLGVLDECHRLHGDAFTLNIAGYGKFVMLSNPETVREVFRGDPDVLHSGEANEVLSASLGRSSVLLLDGAATRGNAECWCHRRRASNAARFDAMRLEAARGGADALPVGEPFETLPIMRRIALRIILRTGLGLDAGPEMDEYQRKIENLLAQGRQRHALVLMKLVPIRRLRRSRWFPFFRQLQVLNDLLYGLIAARRQGERTSSTENVLDDLLAETHEDGTPLDDQEVRDAIFTILIAGHDTTALAPGLGADRDRATA